jgi:hypothetical protein
LKFITKKIIVAFIFILAFSVGYLRETLFVVINTVIHQYPFPYNPSYLKPPNFLYQLSTSELITIKWLFTFFFFLVFMGLSLLAVHIYFKSKTFNKIVIVINTMLFIFAFILSLIGIVFNIFDEIYPLSRFLVGLLQSPLLTFSIFTLFYFIKKQYAINEPTDNKISS